MPQCSREAAFAALFALLQKSKPPNDSGQWALTGRKLIGWENVQSGSQPCFFLDQGHQETKETTFQLPQWSWMAYMWIYFRLDGSNSQSTPPDTVFNNFLDAVDAVIYPNPQGQRNTLGGLVYQCHIIGMTHLGISPNNAGQGLIVIPIEIIVGI